MPRRLKYVARHEAAHAVVGTYLGLTILSATANGDPDDGESAGFCSYAPIGRSQRVALGIMLAAGAVSDRISRAGRKGLEWTDRQLALGAGWGPADFPWLEAAARALLVGPLATPWDEVAALLLERDLTGREIRQLVRGLK